MPVSFIYLGTSILCMLILWALTERLSPTGTVTLVLLIGCFYVLSIVYSFIPDFDPIALMAAIGLLVLTVLYFVFKGIATEKQFQQLVRTGTWKFPAHRFYEKCTEQRLNDPSDPEQLKKMQAIVVKMLYLYKVEEAYFPNYINDEAIIGYYNEALAAITPPEEKIVPGYDSLEAAFEVLTAHQAEIWDVEKCRVELREIKSRKKAIPQIARTLSVASIVLFIAIIFVAVLGFGVHAPIPASVIYITPLAYLAVQFSLLGIMGGADVFNLLADLPRPDVKNPNIGCVYFIFFPIVALFYLILTIIKFFMANVIALKTIRDYRQSESQMAARFGKEILSSPTTVISRLQDKINSDEELLAQIEKIKQTLNENGTTHIWYMQVCTSKGNSVNEQPVKTVFSKAEAGQLGVMLYCYRNVFKEVTLNCKVINEANDLCVFDYSALTPISDDDAPKILPITFFEKKQFPAGRYRIEAQTESQVLVTTTFEVL